MRTHSFSLCLALLTAALVPTAAAQAPSVAPGTRVRVTSPAFDLDHAQAVVREIHGDTLALVVAHYRIKRSRLVSDTASADIPLDAIDVFEVSTGSASNFGRGLLGGTLVGAGLGLGLAMGMSAADSTDGADIGTAIGGMSLLGMVIGGFIGAVSHHDIWEAVTVPSRTPPVTLHLGSGPRGARTVGVGMTLRF